MENVNKDTQGCLITVTKFGDDTDAIATPLVLANAARAAGEDVVVWLTMDGVKLAKEGNASDLVAKSFAPVDDLLSSYIESGGRIGVCPPCAKTHGVTEDNMVENAEWMGAVALLEQSRGWRTLSF